MGWSITGVDSDHLVIRHPIRLTATAACIDDMSFNHDWHAVPFAGQSKGGVLVREGFEPPS